MGWLGSILKAAAPIAGFALGGPLGAMAGSALSSGISGAEKGSQADKLRKAQQAYADQRFAAGSPFRSKLAQLALNPTAQREDLSSMFADPGNPYSRANRPSLAAQAFPPQPAPVRPPVPSMGGGSGGMPPGVNPNQPLGPMGMRRPGPFFGGGAY